MCRTGDYHERGIWGLDGYQAEFVIDKEQYVVHVPPELEPIGVLAEPLSVVEKAIDEAVRIQFCRLPDAQATPLWLAGRRCLVAGPADRAARGVAPRVRASPGVRPPGRRARQYAARLPEALGGQYIDGRQWS